MTPAKCAHCGQDTVLVNGEKIYPHRRDLYRKWFWRCTPCRAHVGCHPGGTDAMGTAANAELRRARNMAHAALDPMWKGGDMPRGKAYALLARRLGVPKIHVGESDAAMCARIVELIQSGELERL